MFVLISVETELRWDKLVFSSFLGRIDQSYHLNISFHANLTDSVHIWLFMIYLVSQLSIMWHILLWLKSKFVSYEESSIIVCENILFIFYSPGLQNSISCSFFSLENHHQKDWKWIYFLVKLPVKKIIIFSK